jgi:zinc protease
MKKIKCSFLGVLLIAVPILSKAAAVVPVTFDTKNGVPVYFVERNNLPIVDIAVIFSAGSVRDGSKWGIANLTQQMMGHETQHYSEKEVSDRIAETGAILDSILTRDMSVWTLRSLSESKKLNRSTEVFHAILTQPSFSKNIFLRLKDQTRVAILESEQDPMSLATNAFFETMYRGQAYAHPRLGTLTSLALLNEQDSLDFYTQYYTARNASIILVGDLTPQQAKKLADTLSSGMLIGEAAPVIEPVIQQKKADVFVPLKKEQTTLVMGQLGFPPYSNYFYARLVGNDIFGGAGLNSILANEVRKKRGLAYFAYSQLTPLQGDGPFVIASQSREQNVKEVYRTIREAYHQFLNQNVSPERLEETKNSMIGGYKLANVTNTSLLLNLIPMVFYHFPLDYFQTFVQKIEAVTQQDVLASFSTLKGKPLVTVMVGRTNAFEEKR